ncbi:adenine deaminase C-terminal domain-containing protein [Geomicrobium sediminis]|uniref:adenine deaminase n=1 Tax=Geomicrobium sediminis TaxID=1347788 RepID=A0ABS2PAB9_9BACL|nr:adenine deaminase C-terminal domain-containing protein [Geomicrobium sediminis]MBM7632086.1 adenine deaminase [Geomicrobium sediminis]
MANQTYSKEVLQQQVNVVDLKEPPTLLLKNVTYLHSYLHTWMKGNIWIYGERIVYVGKEMPEDAPNVMDCSDMVAVPGYIEPHVHPFQLYNPVSLAHHAARFGTTTLICDNLSFLLGLSTEEAHRLLDELRSLPSTLFWWSRFDAQSLLNDEASMFTGESVKAWLDHPLVVQGGELTGWPRLLQGDENMHAWVRYAKENKKRMEGHFPGASEKTLAKLMLLGAESDHEAMTADEVITRLSQGYYVTIRDSSIRPDLETILEQLVKKGITRFDRLFMTTDGSHPFYYERGISNVLIKKAIDLGVPIIDAYHMASDNIARYYGMDHSYGNIATGRVANINLLSSKTEPTPMHVIAKGTVVSNNEEDSNLPQLPSLKLDWQLSEDDFQFASQMGMHLVNNVIAKPYRSEQDLSVDQLLQEQDECFLMMVARDGSWRLNTVVKGFAQVDGLASSYSGTGDVLLIGKCRKSMIRAFNRVKELAGGIVLVQEGEIRAEIQLPIFGSMSQKPFEQVIAEEREIIQTLKNAGYAFEDPAFTLLFLTATHLPFVRLTQKGLIDVKNQEIMISPVKRKGF